jgi:hypothetical protein
MGGSLCLTVYNSSFRAILANFISVCLPVSPLVKLLPYGLSLLVSLRSWLIAIGVCQHSHSFALVEIHDQDFCSLLDIHVFRSEASSSMREGSLVLRSPCVCCTVVSTHWPSACWISEDLMMDLPPKLKEDSSPQGVVIFVNLCSLTSLARCQPGYRLSWLRYLWFSSLYPGKHEDNVMIRP